MVGVRGISAIALTGCGMDEDIRRSRETGFKTYMTMPIDFNRLEAMIRQVADRPTRSKPAHALAFAPCDPS